MMPFHAPVLRFFVVAFLLSAAATAWSSSWRGPAVEIGAAGERVCAKHHRQLARITLYGPGEGVCVLVQSNKEAAKAAAASPNALPLYLQREKNGLYTRAVEISYCGDCNREVVAAIAKRARSAGR